MAEFDCIFQAMSDRTRQKILLLLQEHSRCVRDLVDQFHLSQPTISKHLLTLKNAGLVCDERRGNHVIYSLDHDSIRELAGFFQKFHCCSSLFENENISVKRITD